MKSDPDLPPNRKSTNPVKGLSDLSHTPKKQSLKILPVREHELLSLARCYMRAYLGLEKYGEPSIDKASRYLWHLFRVYPHGFFKVQVNEQLAGFIVFDPEWHDHAYDKVVEVHEIVVDPSWQGYGLGGKLLRLVIDLAVKMDRDTVSLWAGEENKKAIDWYTKKFGFIQDRKEGIWIHFYLPIKAAASSFV